MISKDLLDETINIISTLNPNVAITPISKGIIDFETLNMNYYHIPDEKSTNTVETKPKTIVLSFAKEPTMDQLKEFLSQLTSHFHRAKGYVQIEDNWFKVDSVNSQICIEQFDVQTHDNDFEGLNELVLLSSKGISSISHISVIAETVLKGIYGLQM